MNSLRAALSRSFSRMPKRPPRAITCMVVRPSVSTSGLPAASSAIGRGPISGWPPMLPATPGCRRTITLDCRSSNTPALPGALAGSVISFVGALPNGFDPSCSQKSPVTVSQPPSALRRSSRWVRHFATSAAYAASWAATGKGTAAASRAGIVTRRRAFIPRVYDSVPGPVVALWHASRLDLDGGALSRIAF